MDEKTERLNQIPVLHVRGTHFIVGYTIGRQFKSLILDVLEKCDYFQQSLLPSFETSDGKTVFGKTLELCQTKFPQYVREIEGMSQGANVPFHKLFLLNMEVFMTSPTEVLQKEGKDTGGCSSIMSNNDKIIMGHTEDAGPELLNNVYIVSAEIVNDSGEQLEKFTTLAYAGCLPGYTMGFNDKGFVHTINTLCPLRTNNQKSPRSFIARSLFRASNLEEALEILKDKGTGIADGFSINAHFAKGPDNRPVMYNIEVAPAATDADESCVNVMELKHGETYVHCNKYLRMTVEELPRAWVSSGHRHKAIEKHPLPKTIDVVKDILSDQSHPEYSVFRMGRKPDLVNTVAVGIFDLENREWNIYTEPPNKSEPVAKIPLNFKL